MQWIGENNSLIKEFQFDNFVQAVEFVNKILPLAEDMNHHPDILIHGYNKVRITLSTHSEGRVTEKDRELAQKIDQINV